MMEKQARIKVAAATLRSEMRAVANEQAENIKISAHNTRVHLTQAGQPKAYKRAAFSRMIQAAKTLVDDAMIE